jgi:hypothetical protein
MDKAHTVNNDTNTKTACQVCYALQTRTGTIVRYSFSETCTSKFKNRAQSRHLSCDRRIQDHHPLRLPLRLHRSQETTPISLDVGRCHPNQLYWLVPWRLLDLRFPRPWATWMESTTTVPNWAYRLEKTRGNITWNRTGYIVSHALEGMSLGTVLGASEGDGDGILLGVAEGILQGDIEGGLLEGSMEGRVLLGGEAGTIDGGLLSHRTGCLTSLGSRSKVRLLRCLFGFPAGCLGGCFRRLRLLTAFFL